MTVHDRAVTAAFSAAFAVAEDEFWMLGGGKPSGNARRAWAKEREGWLGFVRENRTAPAEALWIRAGALKLHNARTPFADLPAMVRLGFVVFQQVLHLICDALDEAERSRLAAEAAEKRAAAERARKAVLEDLEGTPMEPVGSALDLSGIAWRAPVKAEGQSDV